MLAVDRSALVAVHPGEIPLVLARLDHVADTGHGALQSQGHAVLVDAAELDEVGADLRGEPCCLLVGVHDQQRALAGECVGQPRPRGAGLGLLDRAGIDEPAVLVVLAEHGLVTITKPQ